MRIISASIDLSKIDKSRIVDKDGKKFYNLTIIVNDTPNQYGQDVGITTEQTKEERERKENKTYLGNGKTVYNKELEAPKLEKEPQGDALPF
jgi:hypothetical protein